MERLPMKKGNEIGHEKIRFLRTFYGKYRVIAAFVVCAAILTAAFALGCIIYGRGFGWEGAQSIGDSTEGETHGSESMSDAKKEEAVEPPLTFPDSIPIVDSDLSYLLRGENYILNETDYIPDFEALAQRKLDLIGGESVGADPLVLVLHTHTRESYFDENSSLTEGTISDKTYSTDREKNMLAVGKVLCEVLSQNGISALHCTVDHMQGGMLQGSYARAEDSIAAYKKQYPSIRLVIDLHRDAVLTSDGEYVKSSSPGDEATAQIMPVVGSNRNGTQYSQWEDNLALALRLRAILNQTVLGICRPVYLRSSSYNQELVPYALLIEVGTGGNSLEEAKRTARILGDALSVLIQSP